MQCRPVQTSRPVTPGRQNRAYLLQIEILFGKLRAEPITQSRNNKKARRLGRRATSSWSQGAGFEPATFGYLRQLVGVEFLHAIGIEFAGIAVFLRREPSFDLERVWIFPHSEGKRFKPGYEVFEMRPAGCVMLAVLREAQRVYVLREWREDGEPAVAKELIATPNSGGLPMMRSMSLRTISAFCSPAGLIVDICYFFLFPYPLRSFWYSASVILLSSRIFRRILAGISGNPSI